MAAMPALATAMEVATAMEAVTAMPAAMTAMEAMTAAMPATGVGNAGCQRHSAEGCCRNESKCDFA
jgi:hypothetical protein